MKEKFIFYSIALLASVIFVFITQPFKLGVTPDSVSYIEVAKNIADGNGMVNDKGEMVNHWPPVYSGVLAGFSVVSGQEVLVAGRLLNVVLLFFLVSVFHSVLKELQLNTPLSIVLLVSMLLSKPMAVFSMFWSEGLFIVLFLCSLLYFIKWVHHQRIQYIIIAGILGGILLLTRYAGIGFLGGFVFYLLLIKLDFKLKLKNLLVYALPILFLFACWTIYTYVMGSTGHDREWVFHMISWKKFTGVFFTISSWFFPSQIFVVTGILLLVILLYKVKLLQKSGWTIQEGSGASPKKIQLLIGASIGSYMLFLLLSILFMDAHTPLNDRILAPLLPLFILLLGMILNRLITSQKMKFISYVIAVFLLTGSTASSIPVWENHYHLGSSYTGIDWMNSATLDYLKQRKKLRTFSNGKDVLRLHNYHTAVVIPFHTDPVTMKVNKHYEREIAEMQKEIEAGSQLVYFDHISWRWYLMPRQEILDRYNEMEIQYFEDGFIVRKP